MLFVALVFTIYIFRFIYSGGDELLKVVFLNVGQGDSIYIETPSGKQFLIDGGENKTAQRKLSEILPFYDTTLDGIFMTHTDKDHSGGLFDILQNLQVKNVFNSGLFNAEEIRLGLQDLFSVSEEMSLREGDVIDFGDGVFLEVLWPPRVIADVSLKDSNDFSLVLRLVFGENSFIFMGDAPKQVENYIISKYGTLLDIDVLKVGHHGSKTSTSEEFLSATTPELSIISAGKDNSYGHPHREVLDLLNNFNSKILETSEIGNIFICTDGFTIRLCE